jgi:hypothetical protein
VYVCLERDMAALNYTAPFSAWLRAFPRDQVLLLQYETLTDPVYTPTLLRSVKS